VLLTGEADLIKIKKDMAAEIEPVYDGEGLTGNVYSVTPYVDRDTMAGTVIVKAENKTRKIKPGMSVKVRIKTAQRKGFMVPESAVLMGEGKTYIFINDNGAAKRIDVQTGYMEGDRTEITGNLAEGTEVITEGNFKLYEGAKVSVVRK
jgi:RND family efflux transporter MFP subunit